MTSLSRNHEHGEVRIGFAQEELSVSNGSCGVQGFSLVILEVEHGLRKQVRGKLDFSYRACEDLVASAAKYFKLHLRTRYRLELLTAIETFA
jgi:hypothetical protein